MAIGDPQVVTTTQMEVTPKQREVICMTACRSTRNNLQSNELGYEENVEHDTFLRDWRAHLLVEYSKNKLSFELLDRFIHDDKVEYEIIVYEDEIYFVLESIPKEKLITTTNDKPVEVTLETHPHFKDCTTMYME